MAYGLVMTALGYAACGKAELLHDVTVSFLDEMKSSIDARRAAFAGTIAKKGGLNA